MVWLPEGARARLAERRKQALDWSILHLPRIAYGDPISVSPEGVIYRAGNSVVKMHNSEYHRHLIDFERRPEEEILERVQDSDFFVRYLGPTVFGIRLEALDGELGDYRGINQVHDRSALLRFLDALPDELARLGIRHHDIHPGNIMYEERHRRYKLIDPAWARFVDEGEPLLIEYPREPSPPGRYWISTNQNPRYSIDDGESIEQLLRELRKA